MGRKITIEPVTRIEGHGRVTIHLDDQGVVEQTFFHVDEFRGLEKFCEGRPYYEMPQITQRICGICPISHHLAASKACDAVSRVRAYAHRQIIARIDAHGTDSSVTRHAFFPSGGA